MDTKRAFCVFAPFSSQHSYYKYSMISNRHVHRSASRLPVKCPSFVSEGKGRAIPVQAWEFPEGSRRLRLPDFKTIGT